MREDSSLRRSARVDFFAPWALCADFVAAERRRLRSPAASLSPLAAKPHVFLVWPMMDKTFDFAAVERRIGAFGKRPALSAPGVPERAERRAVLHRHPAAQRHRQPAHGPRAQQHAAGRAQPLLAHEGNDVLWQPGTDHAGIATQMVVERQLAERQEPDRRTLGREKFLERVWAWKAESGGAIVGQLKRLGASCDWSRERFTLDEGLTKAVAKVFVQFHRDGLIYRDKRLVNWDPKFQTAISDLEVVQVECKGSFKWARRRRAARRGRARQGAGEEPERPSLPLRVPGR